MTRTGIADGAYEVKARAVTFFKSFRSFIGQVAFAGTVSFGVSEILANLKQFCVRAHVVVNPFGYQKLAADVRVCVFGFGGSFQFAFGESGTVILGGVEVETPVLTVATSGFILSPGGIAAEKEADRVNAEWEAAEDAEQARIDARNARRRANRKAAKATAKVTTKRRK